MINEAEPLEIHRKVSHDLVEGLTLSTFTPLGNLLDLESLLYNSINCLDDKNGFQIASIPQREILFFDETFDVLAILQSSSIDGAKLNSYLKRLTITVEGQVLNTVSENQDVFPTHETIFTLSIQDIENPLFIIQVPHEGDKSYQKTIFIVWKVSISLERTKIRFQSPSIVFSAKATLRPLEIIDESVNDEYLPSQIPSTINLLEALGNDSSIGGVKPRLSALRVSRVTPLTQPSSRRSSLIKSNVALPIKVHPAINAKVKYSRIINFSTDIRVVASVEIDVTPFADCETIIKIVKLNLKEGRVENLSEMSGLSLPLTSTAMDSLVFTYLLSINEFGRKTLVQDLEITIIAMVNLSSVCQPLIEMNWTASLSFTSPVNPGFIAPTSSIKRSHKPAQLSIDVDSADPKLLGNNLLNTRSAVFTSTTGPMEHDHSPTVTNFGITITFFSSSSSSPIHPGIPFIWNVFILNRSDRFRKLALIVMPKGYDEESFDPPPTENIAEQDPEIANAAIDENIIYAMQKSSCRAIEVICLTTTQEVGPLSPMACHEVELKFVAYDFGTIHVEAVRIVDLDTQTHVDVRDLPTVFISPVSES